VIGRQPQIPGSGLEYFVLDVFTETRLQGNPLAVVLDTAGLGTEAMQAIAREMNLSETTFVQRGDPAAEQREGVRVRIFTTQEELPFAGHPTLGTASLLRAIAPECVTRNDGGAEVVALALKVGAVPVRFAAQSGAELWPQHGEMTQRDPEFGAVLDPLDVAGLTGLDIADFDPERPIQVVSTGTAFAIVPLRSAEPLKKLKVRQDEATTYLRARGARWFFVLGPDGSDGPGSAATRPAGWRARMQFNGGEDPATGSAAGCAISHLVRYGAAASGQAIHLRQGVEMGRPSDLYLSARMQTAAENDPAQSAEGKVTDVRVGGSTIPVASGRLFLP
jgi:trans-2,3-dihydro-3-hydroxyanthranilate isomerase